MTPFNKALMWDVSPRCCSRPSALSLSHALRGNIIRSNAKHWSETWMTEYWGDAEIISAWRCSFYYSFNSHRNILENLEIRLLMFECRLRYKFQANAKFKEILSETEGWEFGAPFLVTLLGGNKVTLRIISHSSNKPKLQSRVKNKWLRYIEIALCFRWIQSK